MKRAFSWFLNLRLPVAAALTIAVIGCGAAAAATGLDRIDSIMNAGSTRSKVFTPPLPDSPDFLNYNAAQRLYASRSTIIWCTTTWGNASAPLVTVPIAGKLTSSSVSIYPSTRDRAVGDGGGAEWTPERRSVDGMYHGSPPPYRYGFTPGGQYVDFSGMEVFCTTALSKFQRQNTKVSISIDDEAKAADAKAQAALKRGDKAGAQAALEAALGDR